eukprot:CAMPEP_0174277886 /NCGR_PEP_ID=MMETSP0439-20130205/61179_1 /TAXON_ID=0 /ORGANISM="Stereomyxa ramosa, Strain Chinc5" /LENGTH=190 /DNA_ID=CAMNT_0015370251 /DNA_START=541 /DNA_END=1110 /DNA_ORIENTATION=+
MERLEKEFPSSKYSFSQVTPDFCFDFFDVNSDGHLEIEEFIHGVSVLTHGTIEEKAELGFSSLASAEGKITYKTMRARVRQILDLCIIHIKQEGERQGLYHFVQNELEEKLNENRKLFENNILSAIFALDVTGDNKISKDEWMNAVAQSNQTVLSFLDPTSMLLVNVQEIKKQLDELDVIYSKEKQQKRW